MLDHKKKTAEVRRVDLLAGEEKGTVTLDYQVFGADVRHDLLHRMIRYQQAKRRAGTSQVQNRSDVGFTGKKSVAQKGSGGARHGNKAAPQFRKGGRAFGPHPRDHAFKLPKKVRLRALQSALSDKAGIDRMVALDGLYLGKPSTKAAERALHAFEMRNVLIVHDADISEEFALSVRNLANVDLLPISGINVEDIIRHEWLLMTVRAIDSITERLGRGTRASGDDPRRPGKVDAEREAGFTLGKDRSPRLVVDRHEVLTMLAQSDPAARRRAISLIDGNTVTEAERWEVTARLLPMVLAGKDGEALQAAYAVCRVAFPDHYEKYARPYRVLRSVSFLRRLRRDIEAVMAMANVQFVIYAETSAKRRRRRTIRIIATRTLRLDLGHEKARLQLDDARRPDVRLVVGGQGVVTEPLKELDQRDELYVAQVDCRLVGSREHLLLGDVFVDGQWARSLRLDLATET